MSDPVVSAPCGRVRGRRSDGCLRFDGIPFAAPPLGARRFEPPAPPAALGRPPGSPFDATRPGPAPLQRPGPALGTRPVGVTSEDCLHLNLVTPTLDGSRPVLVWIHGGGFVNGSAADAPHAGERLALCGDLVLVTFDYRLGVLGFLHRPEAPGPGLADQLAALRWVRTNVAAFGGDPQRVTLCGESAGAMSIRALMATPAADDLFGAAILQSGAGIDEMLPEDAVRVRSAFASEVGSDDPAHWRTLDAETLLDAQSAVGAQIRALTGRGAWRPLIDGRNVVTDGVHAQARPVNRSRPLLLGMNADEQRLFVNLRHPMAPEAARARLARALGGRVDDPATAAAALLDGYARLLPDASEAERLSAAETDLYYRLPMLRLAGARAGAQAPTFQYLFAWPSPALRGRLGACHALEIPFLFGTLEAPGMARFTGADDAARALSDRIIDAWSAFARDGTPRAAVPDWQPWDPGARACWVADRECRMEAGAGEAALALWRTLWPDGGRLAP